MEDGGIVMFECVHTISFSKKVGTYPRKDKIILWRVFIVLYKETGLLVTSCCAIASTMVRVVSRFS